ncbi:hypothetical protein KO465_10055 [Candidatus Micrarchaeota archaeon]|jgi:hypothetical protein|nr:hypothetical protein [Candidatus Micrarchaeota archaeon]
MILYEILTQISTFLAANWLPILSALGSIGTLIAAYFAYRTVSVARLSLIEQRENSRPRIVAYLEQGWKTNSIIYLKILNDGYSSAKDISFKIKGTDIDSIGKEKFSQIGTIKNGIPLLAAKQSISIPLAIVSGEAFQQIMEAKTSIEVLYSDFYDTDYMDNFILGFKSLVEYKLSGDTPMSSLVKSVEEIGKEMKSTRRLIEKKTR